MSYYNPVPIRVWSRVQNPCSTFNGNLSSDLVYDYLTNQFVSLEVYNLNQRMLQKGNVLQYKKNSSNITKKQKYSQIMKGKWANRTKTFASQTQTYSNPNTSNLLRINSVTIPYPNFGVGLPNNPSGPFQTGIPNPDGCPTTDLQDGGNLVCNATINPCTQEIISTFKNPLCYPSTFSDVPGKMIPLCWNDGITTWYPRQRYVMPNSLDKWPEGYKGFVSGLDLLPPVLTGNSNTLSWTDIVSNCVPVLNYNVYQNGVLIKILPNSQTSITNLPSASFYITASNNDIVSEPSNTITL